MTHVRLASALVVSTTLALALVGYLGGCGSSGDGVFPGDLGTYDGDAGVFLRGDASPSGTLDAHIERNHITVTFVTLSCTGPCADVVAVPTGGVAPYSFKWDDGSTTAARRVCPTLNTKYDVDVTDTATLGELPTPAETVQVSLAAEVISCPDGGIADADGGACISNPSFEGPPANDTVNAPPWVACGYQATIANPSVAYGPEVLQPADGNTALFLRAQGDPPVGAASEPLCATMHAGMRYAVTLDIASNPQSTLGATPAPEGLQIWGGTGSCAEGELLWSSPLAGPTWQTYCATLSPTQDATYLTLVAYQAPDAGTALGLGNVQVDDMVPVAACP